jgi:hypothetical protein
MSEPPTQFLFPGLGTLKSRDAMFFVKATDKHMRGHNGYGFELGKIYHHLGQVRCCHEGFHCCDTLGDIDKVSLYDNDGHTRYFIVKAWGEYETVGAAAAKERKHAFECICFMTELKYNTLEDVQQARAAITATFRGAQRETNLKDFDELQAQFPSILKKRVKHLRTKSVVLEDVNHCTVPRNAIVKQSRACRRLCVSHFVSTNTSYPHRNKDAKYDIYHHNHEPVMGIRGYKAASNYFNTKCM